MPADGSQFLTRRIQSVTSRGDGSRQDHEQTVTYQDQKDTAERLLTEDKVIETTQENEVAPRRTTETKEARVIDLTIELEFMDGTVIC